MKIRKNLRNSCQKFSPPKRLIINRKERQERKGIQKSFVFMCLAYFTVQSQKTGQALWVWFFYWESRSSAG